MRDPLQKAGRESRGHRFHNPDNVRISSPAAYLEDLRRVLADFAERRELIAGTRGRTGRRATGQRHRVAEPARRRPHWPGVAAPLVCSSRSAS
ncbi:hypothetical protein ACPA9J_24510 [Pseudomonas aeruginosa]